MGSNVLISKKLSRDLGSLKEGGVHIRKNLKEIIAVEALFQTEGWLEDPEIEKDIFENMDRTAKLSTELSSFWFSCGQNRDNGINSILHDQPVMFKDVLVTELESDSGKSDMKTMLKTLPLLISEIPDTNQIKTYISELFSSEIVMSKNLNRVTEFYFLVLQIVHDYSEQLDNSESESDED